MRRLSLPVLLLAMTPMTVAASSPEALRGPWLQGECVAPRALLHLTARAAARLPLRGEARLLRIVATGEMDGWTVLTGPGAEAPRLLLRPVVDGLETVEPDAKTRDDRLPGDAPVTRWQRCASVPPGMTALHGEGVAVLAALEHLEAACWGDDIHACLGAAMTQADVSGDGTLSAAELARLARGLVWIQALQAGATVENLAATVGLGALAGIGAARGLIESLDYDGDGRLSAAELAQDRIGFGAATGHAGGRALAVESLQQALDMLRDLLGSLDPGR